MNNLLGELSYYLYFALAAMVCIPIHEFSHGYVAYKLGDPTAKRMGRLTLNPIKHFDPVGFLMMVVAGFGFAKPVPVDMRYFARPKWDMALVGLAGPLSNFLLALLFLLITSAMEAFLPYSGPAQIVYNFFFYAAILSTGLGVFNLIPISPLDGSKIIGAFLPEHIYYTILRYERYGTFVLLGLILLGRAFPQFDFFGRFLTWARSGVFEGLRALAELPFASLSGR